MEKSSFVGGVILLLILFALGFYLLRDTNLDVEPPVGVGPIGLWEIEKGYIYNQTIGQFVESAMIGGPFYQEFTRDGKWCSEWVEKRCYNYDSYSLENDILFIHQEGVPLPEMRYRWEFYSERLRLTGEILENNTNVWSPMVRYVLKPSSR